jgi:lipopolysaccharide/colanic/teichoic acid biosynthesis glycosyltransferase
MGLVVFSPTFLLVSMAIKLDSRGPVFRRRRLYGYTGEETLVWTFRFNEFTTKATISSRTTRVGDILRSSGVEEFPQLINVLFGEMSIVGPQPLLTAPELRLPNQFFLRQHKMRPGLISWAQVNGFGREVNTQEAIGRRIAYDLYYLEHWSFVLDMKIIAMNVRRNTV